MPGFVAGGWGFGFTIGQFYCKIMSRYENYRTRWGEGLEAVYKRVLLKLSGEALAGDKGFGIDEATVASICEGIAAAHRTGVQMAIVVGGGNFWRGRSSISSPLICTSKKRRKFCPSKASSLSSPV